MNAMFWGALCGTIVGNIIVMAAVKFADFMEESRLARIENATAWMRDDGAEVPPPNESYAREITVKVPVLSSGALGDLYITGLTVNGDVIIPLDNPLTHAVNYMYERGYLECNCGATGGCEYCDGTGWTMGRTDVVP